MRLSQQEASAWHMFVATTCDLTCIQSGWKASPTLPQLLAPQPSNICLILIHQRTLTRSPSKHGSPQTRLLDCKSHRHVHAKRKPMRMGMSCREPQGLIPLSLEPQGLIPLSCPAERAPRPSHVDLRLGNSGAQRRGSGWGPSARSCPAPDETRQRF